MTFEPYADISSSTTPDLSPPYDNFSKFIYKTTMHNWQTIPLMYSSTLVVVVADKTPNP
jgi:hypothetical protein